MQVYFKTNKYFIRERPNLRNYVRDLYHIPGAEAILALHVAVEGTCRRTRAICNSMIYSIALMPEGIVVKVRTMVTDC